MFDQVDEVDAVARRIGAINTVSVNNDRWVGANTDASGFLRPLQERMSLHGMRVSVLGAGGAARAVLVALASSGCSVRVHARDRFQAEDIALRTPVTVGPWPPDRGSWDLLINCTPIGMYPHVDATPMPREQLTGKYVYDLVYNPPVTRLLREAARDGLPDDRRPRDARRPGPRTVSVVDRHQASDRCHEKCRTSAAGGVCWR